MHKQALWNHLKSKAEERQKLAKELEQQIYKQNEAKRRQKELEKNYIYGERQFINEKVGNIKKCVHGKMYLCTECNKKYPKKMVSKKYFS